MQFKVFKERQYLLLDQLLQLGRTRQAFAHKSFFRSEIAAVLLTPAFLISEAAMVPKLWCLQVCALHGPAHWGGLRAEHRHVLRLLASSQHTPCKPGRHPTRRGSVRALVLETNLQYLITKPHLLHSHPAVGKD